MVPDSVLLELGLSFGNKFDHHLIPSEYCAFARNIVNSPHHLPLGFRITEVS